MIQRLLEARALHMVLLGGLGFVLFGDAQAPVERPRIEISGYQVEALAQEFLADTGRPPGPAEIEAIVESLIDDEVLYHYAISLGLHENSAAQARLAQIAEFVEANPHGEHTTASQAQAAFELGLGHSDLVTRRILTDSARRLIRAVVLLQAPSEEQVAAFFAANRAEFELPAEIELVQVAVNAFKWPQSEAHARELLAQITSRRLTPEAALALADEMSLPPRLQATTEPALAALFDRDFAAAVFRAPVGGWSGPIPSRYGHHLVWVVAKKEKGMPPLEPIRPAVEDKLRQRLADEWLTLRLRELRAEFEIVAPKRPT